MSESVSGTIATDTKGPSAIGSLLTEGLSKIKDVVGSDSVNTESIQKTATNIATNVATNAITKFLPGGKGNAEVNELVSGAVGEASNIISGAIGDVLQNPAALFQDPGKFTNDLIQKFIPKPRVFYSAQLFPYCFLIPMCILCLYTIGDVRKKLTNVDFANMRSSFNSLRMFLIVVTAIMLLFFLYLGRMGSKYFDPDSMPIFAILTIITVFLLYGTKVYMNVQFLIIEMNLSKYPQVTMGDYIYIKNKFKLLNSYIGSMMTLTLLAAIPAALMKLLEFVKNYLKDLTSGIKLPF
jgi:hypothetical protein